MGQKQKDGQTQPERGRKEAPGFFFHYEILACGGRAEDRSWNRCLPIRRRGALPSASIGPDKGSTALGRNPLVEERSGSMQRQALVV
jgi:hypothetical protein